MTLETLWKVRSCFICEQYGACKHRDLDLDLAIVNLMNGCDRETEEKEPHRVDTQQKQNGSSTAGVEIGRRTTIPLADIERRAMIQMSKQRARANFDPDARELVDILTETIRLAREHGDRWRKHTEGIMRGGKI